MPTVMEGQGWSGYLWAGIGIDGQGWTRVVFFDLGWTSCHLV